LKRVNKYKSTYIQGAVTTDRTSIEDEEGLKTVAEPYGCFSSSSITVYLAENENYFFD